MNILPLVSAFILIFAICSYTFFYSASAALLEESHFKGAHKIERLFTSRIQRKLFSKIKAQGDENSPQSHISSTNFHSPRDYFNLPPEAKFNITVLLKEGDRPKKEALFLELIRHLYEFTTVYKPGLECDLLEALKKNPKLQTFQELLKETPELYKLVKGTNRYNLGRFEGYPALDDFFIFDKTKNAKLINYCHAARPILDALFGRTLAPKIINEEKHKWEQNKKHAPLTKQELEAFLLTQNKNITEYEPLLFFSGTRHAQTQDVLHDGTSNIQVKIQR